MNRIATKFFVNLFYLIRPSTYIIDDIAIQF